MGVSGKGRTMQFFITDNEMYSLLSQLMQSNTVIIEGRSFENKTPETFQNASALEWPSSLNDQTKWLWKPELGDLILEPGGRFLPNKYWLVPGPSPIIQLNRCRLEGNTLISGAIAAMISFYNENGDEIMKSESYKSWWKEIKKNFKRGLTICVIREGKKEHKTTLWASPGAIKLYEEGVDLKQTLQAPVFFHPKL
jgi:hypothetical protein